MGYSGYTEYDKYDGSTTEYYGGYEKKTTPDYKYGGTSYYDEKYNKTYYTNSDGYESSGK